MTADPERSEFPSPAPRSASSTPSDPTTDRPPASGASCSSAGPQVFGGYWQKPDETRGRPLDDGWFRTGDIVEVDPDGFVSIVDRIKEIIITGGFNVMPSEVEAVLRDHAGRHRRRGRRAAQARRQRGRRGGGDDSRPGADARRRGVRQRCRSDLAAYKVPRRVVVVDELPRSQIGKVLRKQVRDSLIDA